ncbi:MAG TPA: SRPBCC family protein [Kofleriaceae bacterium]
MPTVVVEVARSPEDCWRAFTNARLFAAWMPGLRRVTVVSAHDDGLPREVLFELSTSLTYTLTYSYDLAKREVRWEPRINARDGVRGYVVLEPSERGTRMTYKLEQGAGRTMGDLVIGGSHAIVEAFVRWVERT